MTPSRRGQGASHARSARRAKGFTLLELIVVLSLMALITASVVPVFSGSLSGLKHDNALRNLVSLIKFVQEKAVSEGQLYRVCFDTDENTYWVMQPAEDPEAEHPFVKVGDRYGRVRELPSGMEFRNLRLRDDRDGDYEYFECYPNGATDEVRLEFDFPRDRSRRMARISIEGMLGRVELEE